MLGGKVMWRPGTIDCLPTLPVATQPDGSPIVAPVRIEYSDRTIPAEGTFTLGLEGSPNFVPYASADTDTARSTLTVRETLDGQKTPCSADQVGVRTMPHRG